MSERLCVVSTMRNEGPFVLEWVAHYKALGFDDLVVCTNDCEDTTADLLLALQDRGFVRHHETIKPVDGALQLAAIKQALRYSEVRRASWVFVCDADEFLNVKFSDGSARALITESEQDADGIWVPWRVFGSNGVDRFCDAPVKAQFVMGQATPRLTERLGNWGKSFHRRASVDKFRSVGVHKPNARKSCSAGFRINLPGGLSYARDGVLDPVKPSFDLAQVNHYALRSLDSYLVKRARGPGFRTDAVIDLDYWMRFNRKASHDDSIRRYDEAAARYMDRFRRDAQLMKLHQSAVDWQERKAAELRADPELQPLVAAIEARPVRQTGS